MKYKMQDKQNQLIERISDQHLVIGVDIAQQFHVARAVNYRGLVIGKPITFENDEIVFTKFLSWMNELKGSQGFNSEIIGMEPTGHYWLNLSKWLYNQDIDVVTVNPHHVKRNKENRDNTQSKSDKKDALVIADMVKNGYYSFIHPTTETFEELRVLMSNRDFITKRLVSSINQINRWVDIVFPELRQVFKDVKGKGAIATLRLFPTPSDIRSLDVQDIIKGWRTQLTRHAGFKKAQSLIQLAKVSVGTTQALDAYKLHLEQLLEEFDLATVQLEKIEQEAEALTRHAGFKKAQSLIQLAKVSVGTTQALDAYKLHLEQLLEEFDLATVQLEKIEQEAEAVLDKITYAKKILDIKGISETTLGGILGEAGDLSNFAHGNSLLRHAGLNLAEASSGKWKGQIVVSKRGRSRLRRYLFLATMSLDLPR